MAVSALTRPHRLLGILVGFVEGQPVCHLAVAPRLEIHGMRACRLVVLPEWQVAGIGVRFLNEVCTEW